MAKIDVVPSAASLLIKELKEPMRDRKKVKHGMQIEKYHAMYKKAVGRVTRNGPHPPDLCCMILVQQRLVTVSVCNTVSWTEK